MSRTKASVQWRKQMIKLMSISPRTVAELRARIGCSDGYIRKELIKMKDSGECYIADYKNNGNRSISGMSARFAYGQGADVRPPHSVEKQKLSRIERKKNEQNVPWDLPQFRIGEKVACYGILGLA